MDSLRGALLVATPSVERGPFRRSVVFLLDHDEEGALGVIVNHPTHADVDDVLPSWSALVGAPDCLFEGGPVSMDSALAVAVVPAGSSPEGFRPMTGRFGLVDLDGPVPDATELLGLRVFAGYAGWGAGQLEDEIAEGSWLVTDAQDEDVLTPQPENLWRTVLRRQEGDARFLATFPDDPTEN